MQHISSINSNLETHMLYYSGLIDPSPTPHSIMATQKYRYAVRTCCKPFVL